MRQIRRLYTREVLIGLLMALSGIFAYLGYYRFQWKEGAWSVITVASITRADLSKTLLIMILRLLGTIVGAAMALLTLFFLSEKIYTFLLFSMLFTSLLLSLVLTRYRYMMIITGLTYILILSSELTVEFYATAFNRTYEVIFGCLVCAIFSLLFRIAFPILRGSTEPITLSFEFKKQYVLEALLMSIACCITFMTWRYYQYPFGYWATISCLFVLEENIGVTTQKSIKRFFAHFFVMIVASLISIVIPSHSIWILLPLSIGFFGLGYLSALSKKYYASMANTMAIALSVMLLIDYPGLSRDDIILFRFFNVLYGIGIAFLVMSLYEYVRILYKKMT